MKKKSLSVPAKPTRKEMPPRKEKELEFPKEEGEVASSQKAPRGAKDAKAPKGSRQKEMLPWEEAWVREDVRKMLPVYFPEPVYLQLKFVSKNSKVSMNEFVREAVMGRLEKEIAEIRKSR